MCFPLLFAAAALTVVTLASCGGDDEEETETTIPDDSGDNGTGGNTGGGNGGSTGGGNTGSRVDLVGHTYHYSAVEDSRNGKQNTVDVRLTFTSESSYTVTKDCWYWKWQNMAYQQFRFNETGTSTYTRSGSTIRLKGYSPYSFSDSWNANDEWTLTIHNERILETGMGDEYVFSRIR